MVQFTWSVINVLLCDSNYLYFYLAKREKRTERIMDNGSKIQVLQIKPTIARSWSGERSADERPATEWKALVRTRP